jgi:integral membrane sensor domain MASE1
VISHWVTSAVIDILRLKLYGLLRIINFQNPPLNWHRRYDSIRTLLEKLIASAFIEITFDLSLPILLVHPFTMVRFIIILKLLFADLFGSAINVSLRPLIHRNYLGQILLGYSSVIIIIQFRIGGDKNVVALFNGLASSLYNSYMPIFLYFDQFAFKTIHKIRP